VQGVTSVLEPVSRMACRATDISCCLLSMACKRSRVSLCTIRIFWKVSVKSCMSGLWSTEASTCRGVLLSTEDFLVLECSLSAVFIALVMVGSGLLLYHCD
jgi:hypothetical protein